MADTMSFPQTIEEFLEQYKIVDTEQVYSNGVEFVPIFRVKQWFEHLPNPKDIFYDGYAYCLADFGWDTVLCKDCKHQERIAGYSDYQPNTVFCNKWEHLTDIQGHCYKGERKDEVENGKTY